MRTVTHIICLLAIVTTSAGLRAQETDTATDIQRTSPQRVVDATALIGHDIDSADDKGLGSITDVVLDDLDRVLYIVVASHDDGKRWVYPLGHVEVRPTAESCRLRPDATRVVDLAEQGWRAKIQSELGKTGVSRPEDHRCLVQILDAEVHHGDAAIASIDHVLFDSSNGQIIDVILSTGGFLGFDQETVAVSPNKLNVVAFDRVDCTLDANALQNCRKVDTDEDGWMLGLWTDYQGGAPLDGVLTPGSLTLGKNMPGDGEIVYTIERSMGDRVSLANQSLTELREMPAGQLEKSMRPSGSLMTVRIKRTEDRDFAITCQPEGKMISNIAVNPVTFTVTVNDDGTIDKLTRGVDTGYRSSVRTADLKRYLGLIFAGGLRGEEVSPGRYYTISAIPSGDEATILGGTHVRFVGRAADSSAVFSISPDNWRRSSRRYRGRCAFDVETGLLNSLMITGVGDGGSSLKITRKM